MNNNNTNNNNIHTLRGLYLLISASNPVLTARGFRDFFQQHQIKTNIPSHVSNIK